MNLRARQRLWRGQRPPFDIVGWVLDLAGLSPGMQALKAGYGNGASTLAYGRRGLRVSLPADHHGRRAGVPPGGAGRPAALRDALRHPALWGRT